MTRQEFIENVLDFDNLYEVACYYECEDEIGDLVPDAGLDSCLCDEVAEYLAAYGWQALQERLQEIPRGVEWYLHFDWLQYREADNEDFDHLKDALLDELDALDEWDYEDDDEVSNPEETNAPDKDEMEELVPADLDALMLQV